MTVTEPAPPATDRRRFPWRILLGLVVALFATFWVWALFFASREAINKIDDRAWAARAEAICAEAKLRREALTDFRRVDERDAAMMVERGNLVDAATDLMEDMLDDVVAVAPTDEKGASIVPDWEADYRTYLENRRAYAEVLRAGRNEPFTEAAVDGIPISEKIERFAGDNEMPSCAPPTDLS